MGEILQFPTGNERLIAAAETIGWDAVWEVTGKYGHGYDDLDSQAEQRDLAYHNLQHTMHVRGNSRAMAEALDLSPLDMAIVQLAASAHDVIQEGERGQMERESAQWLEQKMAAVGFSEEDRVAAGLAILGTEPLFSQDGLILGQMVNLQEYPSERSRLIALCVASGDMAGLYAPYGPLLSRDIYKEMQGCATADEPGLENMLAFQRIQLDLLQKYRFPHPAGEELFAGLRREVIDYQIAVTQDIWLGEITDWSQLIERDIQFCDLHTALQE